MLALPVVDNNLMCILIIFLDTGDGEMEDDQEELPLQRERQPRMVTDEDGWTTILRR